MNVLNTVVVAARNAEATLAYTLDSLLAQSAGHWEAIVVDDGSTDATRAIASSYAARDGRFSMLTGSGAGVSAARNFGLANAKGERLVFLDSDDWIAPTFLETLGAALDANPRAFAAYCGYQRVTPGGQLTEARFSADLEWEPFEVMARRWGAATHCFLTDRALIAHLGGFDESLRTCEDWDLWQRAARTGARFIGVRSPLAFYRMSPSSLTRDVRAMIADAKRVIARGFSTDSRVAKPAPAHAGGADPAFAGNAELALSYFTLWCAAHEAGRDAAIEPVLAAGRLSDFKDDISTTAEVIFDGLFVGARCAPSDLALRWSAVQACLRDLLGRLEAKSSCGSGLARRLQYKLERRILDATDVTAPTVLGLTAKAQIDIQRPTALTLPANVDRLLLTLHAADKPMGMTELAVFASVSPRDLANAALRVIELNSFVRESGTMLHPLAWIAGALAMARGLARRVRAHDRTDMPALAREALRSAALSAGGPVWAKNTNDAVLDGIIAAARREGAIAAGSLPRAPAVRPRPADTNPAAWEDRQSYWEAMFATPDPWNYGSDYERVKYERTLALVPAGIERALELACAEGRFSERLAGRVGHLTATDIAQTALDRAQVRCAGLSNVAFKRLDLVVDPLPNGLDLIVCSEVLYYLDGRDELAAVGRRLMDALAPGGRLLTAHAFVLKDDLSRTAFDWENPFGAAVISEIMAGTPGLVPEASVETDLYRIDLFRRVQANEVAAPPRVDHMPLGAALETEIARQVVWGGAEIRRADAYRHERTKRLPILMYHRIAEDGPAALARYRTRPEAFWAQMRWLRSHGYHAVSAAELMQRRKRWEQFPGRPVLITFDDGTNDFYDTAWPILRDCDLSAEVFIVTDLAGRNAAWDAEHGDPAPLMNARQIMDLARHEVRFGSHLATHRAADGLASAELAAELARSRAVLEAWTGGPVTALAAPYGITDDRLVALAERCGYNTIFTTLEGVAQLGNDPFRLPRIEVRGDWNLERFTECLRGAR